MKDLEKQVQDPRSSNSSTGTGTEIETDEMNTPKTKTNETNERNTQGPPPDGGTTAWLHALLTHLVFFNSWGFANSYGIFQQYYTDTLQRAQSDIAWIGSVQVFLLFSVGVIGGRATDAGYFHWVFRLGVVVQLLGVFMTSLCETYWQVFLAHAVCVGLGNGLTFCPSLSILSTYFSRNRALAVGIAAAGAASGGLVYPAIVHVLLREVGFPWTLRVVGFIMLVAHIPSILFFKPRLPPYKAGALVEWPAFKEPAYTFFILAMFLNFWGLYFAFFYLGTFARDHLDASTETSVNLLMVINGIGIIGRIIPNLIGDRLTGPFNILIPFSFGACILVYCWAAIESITGIYVFAIIYGFIAAALQSLFPATATTLTTDAKKTGVRLGMILSVVSFACLTGPPIAGALIQAGGGSYFYAQVFAATSILVGALCLVASRVSKSGWNWVKV
ncbi:hypothetical protein NHQ30_008392 [Ciborinia camelliae]|nr:hypothetical protein NHQ30_008392 [Ciborinia camelliae]